LGIVIFRYPVGLSELNGYWCTTRTGVAIISVKRMVNVEQVSVMMISDYQDSCAFFSMFFGRFFCSDVFDALKVRFFRQP
jgi:hypothetical protein